MADHNGHVTLNIMKQTVDYSQKYHSNTVWINPTPHVLRAKIWRGPENHIEPWVYFEFLPGLEVIVPSEYDDALQMLHPKTGKIIGGKCPQLVKKGENRVLDPALDSDMAWKKQAFEQAQHALAQKAVAEQAAILAAGQLAMQENVQRVDEAMRSPVIDEIRQELKEARSKSSK